MYHIENGIIKAQGLCILDIVKLLDDESLSVCEKC